MARNAKLSYWVSSSSKFSIAALCAAFVVFWFCKFFFGSHPHYAIKPLYFHLAIKISAGVSLPLAPMFLGHLYVQLDIVTRVRRDPVTKLPPPSTVLFYSSCYSSIVPNIWQSVNLLALLERSTTHVRG